MRFSVYQVSRKGGREKNEDRMGYCYTRDSGLFALADGMGGHPEGEVASQLALQTLAAFFQKEAKTDLKDPQRFLQDAILAGHHQLLRYATDRKLLRDKVGHGIGILQESAVTPASPMHDTEPTIPYDPAKANALLDAAGWVRGADGIRAKNGVKLNLDYAMVTGNQDNDSRVEQIVLGEPTGSAAG